MKYLAFLLALLFSCSPSSPPQLGLNSDQNKKLFFPCDNSYSCLSSQSNKKEIFIEPFKFMGLNQSKAKQKVEKLAMLITDQNISKKSDKDADEIVQKLFEHRLKDYFRLKLPAPFLGMNLRKSIWLELFFNQDRIDIKLSSDSIFVSNKDLRKKIEELRLKYYQL